MHVAGRFPGPLVCLVVNAEAKPSSVWWLFGVSFDANAHAEEGDVAGVVARTFIFHVVHLFGWWAGTPGKEVVDVAACAAVQACLLLLSLCEEPVNEISFA